MEICSCFSDINVKCGIVVKELIERGFILLGLFNLNFLEDRHKVEHHFESNESANR